ncbi:MAG: lipid A phosphoethanolamine transferase [Muribaculaceae bacterium]|nr:lipid A phosphoethanolamine transferase [Muribaculaceae bacterium]
MKHSKEKDKVSRVATVLMWLLPLALIVPNIALDITEIRYSVMERIINIVAPAGFYLLLCSLFKRIGISTLYFIPVMILNAFQLVLLFLYGESIIAVDMFLNVVTTNVKEASELLLNLGFAIGFVCILYAPAIVTGIYLAVRKEISSVRSRRYGLYTSLSLCVAAIICIAGLLLSGKGYAADRKLFPVNVISNIFSAIHRTELTNKYEESSSNFRYNAICEADSTGQIVVLIIGETSRADNWELAGYRRETNPKLMHRQGLVFYPLTLSESNTTHKSVPLLMSHFDASGFADSIYCSKSIINAFKEAGYKTAWISNQQRNHSFIDFFGSEADYSKFLKDDELTHYDAELCGEMRKFIDSQADSTQNIFIVLHSYGSHFNYRERYPAEYNKYMPDDSTEASKENRDGLINAYDNTILYTDAVVDSVFSILENSGRPAAALYTSDHGEDIYDDRRERFLHASPTPTYWQLHVPLIIWCNETYNLEHPEKSEALNENSKKNVSSSRSAFHTLVSLGGLQMPMYDKSASLSECDYREPVRQYLNDYNEAVSLEEAGLRDNDFFMLKFNGLKN